MAILVRRENAGDLANLAASSGAAVGAMQRQQRQQELDVDFINRALNRAAVRNAGREYFADRADDGNDSGGGGTQGGVQTFVNEEARDAAAARMQADNIRTKRVAFSQAARGGPEALAMYLAGESYAQTGKVPNELLDKLAPDAAKAGAGGDKRTGVPEFQRAVEGRLGAGDVSSLGYAGERTAPTYDPASPTPVTMPTQKSLEALNALQHVVGTMDQNGLKSLREEINRNGMSPQAKSQSLSIVDGALAQRQAMRDVEIRQVHEAVVAKVTERLTSQMAKGAQPASRDVQRKKMGEAIMAAVRQYGISPQEYLDFQRREIGRREAAQDQMGRGMMQQPAGAAPGAQPGGKGGGNDGGAEPAGAPPQGFRQY